MSASPSFSSFAGVNKSFLCFCRVCGVVRCGVVSLCVCRLVSAPIGVSQQGCVGGMGVLMVIVVSVVVVVVVVTVSVVVLVVVAAFVFVNFFLLATFWFLVSDGLSAHPKFSGGSRTSVFVQNDYIFPCMIRYVALSNTRHGVSNYSIRAVHPTVYLNYSYIPGVCEFLLYD